MLGIFILQYFRFHQALAQAHHLTAHLPWGMCKVLHLSGSVLGGFSHQIFLTMTCQRGNPERQPVCSSIPEPVMRLAIAEVKLISWWKPQSWDDWKIAVQDNPGGFTPQWQIEGYHYGKIRGKFQALYYGRIYGTETVECRESIHGWQELDDQLLHARLVVDWFHKDFPWWVLEHQKI